MAVYNLFVDPNGHSVEVTADSYTSATGIEYFLKITDSNKGVILDLDTGRKEWFTKTRIFTTLMDYGFTLAAAKVLAGKHL